MKSAILLISLISIVIIISACTGPKPPSGGECLTDNDCATGGCSSELCGKKGSIEGIPSICIFKPEYACLQETSCSCINYKCVWNQTTEYQTCLENIDNSSFSVTE